MKTILTDSLSMRKNSSPIEISYQSINDFPYHWHDYLEIIIILQGSIELFAGTDSIILNKGDVEILNFSEIHRMVGKPDNVVLSLKIQSDLAQLIAPDIKEIIFNSVVVPYDEDKEEGIKTLGRMIARFALARAGSPVNINESATADIKEILYFIKDNFDIVRHALRSRGLSASDYTIMQGRYRRIADYIFNNYSEKISLRDIAERENLSLYFLSHEIKELFGDGFQELINFQRIKYAMKLLLCSDMNSTEIAYECGYSAPRYLSTYFKKTLNTSPDKYRKKFRESQEQIRTQLGKNNLADEEAINLLRFFLSPSSLFIDALSRGISCSKVWKCNKSGLKRDSGLSESRIILHSESDSMYSGIQIIREEISSLDSDPKKRKLLFDNGLKTPAWFALYFLSFLGDEILDRGEGYISCRRRSSIQVLFFNCSDKKNWKKINLNIKNLNSINKVTRYKLDESNGSLYYKWKQMGQPELFSEDEIRLLDRILYPEVFFDQVRDSASFEVSLPPSGIELIVIN